MTVRAMIHRDCIYLSKFFYWAASGPIPNLSFIRRASITRISKECFSKVRNGLNELFNHSSLLEWRDLLICSKGALVHRNTRIALTLLLH